MDWLKAALLIALVEGLCASDVNEGRTFKIPLKSFLASKLSSSTGSILPPPERERPTWKIHKYQGLELLPITDNVEEDHSSSSPDLPALTNGDKQHNTHVYPPANQLDTYVDQPDSSNSQISNSDSSNALEALDYLAPIANLIPGKRSIKKIHLKTLDPVERTAASVLQLPKQKATAASVLQLSKQKATAASVLHPHSKGGILSSIFHKKKKPLAFFKIPSFKHSYKILPRLRKSQGDSRSFGKIFWSPKVHKLPKLPDVLQLSQAYIPSTPPPVEGTHRQPTLIPDSTFDLINQLNDITKLADHIALPRVPSLPTSLFPLKFKKHHLLKPYIHIKLPAKQITTEHPPERKDIITSVEPYPSPENSYGPPSPPENSYGPPYKPVDTYGPPPPTVDRYESPPYKPKDSYGPPPPPENSYGPPPPPENSYGPPPPSENSYGPPPPPENSYGPPPPPENSYGPPPPPENSYGPPSPPKDANRSPIPADNYGPPPPAASYGAPSPAVDSYGPPPQKPVDTYRPPLPPVDSYGLPPSNPDENYGAPPSTSLSSNQWSFSTHYQSPPTLSDSYGNPINNGWSNENPPLTPYDRPSQSSNHQGSPVYIHKVSASAAASERDDVLAVPPAEVFVENPEDSEREIP